MLTAEQREAIRLEVHEITCALIEAIVAGIGDGIEEWQKEQPGEAPAGDNHDRTERD